MVENSTPNNQSRIPERTPLSRRSVLEGMLGLAAAGVAGRAGRSLFDANPRGQEQLPTQPIEREERPSFRRPFEGRAANDVAENLGITAGNFWMTEQRVMESLTANSESGFQSQGELLPIFPPAIHTHEPAINRIAEELDVPVNVVATIASIESAGVVNSASDADAHGLFQVVPGYHMDKVVDIAAQAGRPIENGETLKAEWEYANRYGLPVDHLTTPDVIDALRDPYIGGKVGMTVLKEYHEAVLQNTNLAPDDPVVWARALAAYNGGPDEAGKKYEDMPTQSQLYSVYAMRYFMTAELASELRNQGFTDPQIAQSLVSTEVDARAYAYSQAKDTRLTGRSDIKAHENIWRQLAKEAIAPDSPDIQAQRLATELVQHYSEYKFGNYRYDHPISPGLRMWLEHGGIGQFNKAPENLNPALYPANQ